MTPDEIDDVVVDDDDELVAPLPFATSSAAAPAMRFSFVVDPDDDRTRLDAWLTSRRELIEASISRTQAQRLIADGRVQVGEVAIIKSHKLRSGDRVVVDVPAAVPLELVPENIPLRILYEDRDLIAIDKPAGLVVHPAPGHSTGTLVHALLFHCGDLGGIGGTLRPGIVHRLDKDTSGVMIASKHDASHAALVAAFHDKSRMVREYVALTAPAPRADSGTLRTLHGRHPIHRKKFTSQVHTGKPAVTHYQVLERFADVAAMVRCRLETGRTHQIRVHCAEHGFGLIADAMYGPRARDARVIAATAAIGRQALHAERLELDHPITGVRLVFTAPPPADFQAAIAALRVR